MHWKITPDNIIPTKEVITVAFFKVNVLDIK